MVISALALCGGACSKKETVTADAPKKRPQGMKFHGDGADSTVKVTRTPVADLIKKKKLNAFPQKTIGDAFDSYTKAISKEWKDDLGRDGRYYVDYICWFDGKTVTPEERKSGVAKKGLDLKFVIHEDGEAYISVAIKLFQKEDGTVQTGYFAANEIGKVVEDIYNNKELNY